MAANLKEITRWFDRGLTRGSTHMIVVCDEFDYIDYPVYVERTENVREVEAKIDGKDMQRVLEVYVLASARRAEQLVPGVRVRNY